MPGSEFQVIEPGSFSEWVWNEKYRYKTDETVDDTFMRVARELASVEPETKRDTQAAAFYGIMRTFEFIPGGRIIAGVGTGRAVTLSNCYVMPQIEDSLDGIMRAIHDAAMTLRSGGGVGMDFSTIRPRRAHVAGLDAEASGPVSFMDMWNTMCGTIMSAGARRGAMMGVLRCDHPNIEEFVTAKRTGGRLTNFNISVAVTNAFMAAVKKNADWPLVFGGKVYKTVKAAELWDLITRSTYETADPGILFIDRANAANPLAYAERLYATNPCVPAETLLLTRDGHVPIGPLEGKDVEIWNGFQWSTVTVEKTGIDQTLVEVVLSNGATLKCTPYHKFILADERRIEARHLPLCENLMNWSNPESMGGGTVFGKPVVCIRSVPGLHDVFCFNEPLNHSAVFNGIMTAQCGEQWLPPGGACLLGSINLTRLVRKPFTPQAGIDDIRLAQVARVAVRMMDNVNDVSNYPLPIQREEAQNKRRIGLGVTGLADALIMLGIRYGSSAAASFTGSVMKQISAVAKEESEHLGEVKGSFPLFNEREYKCKARRNSHLLSIQPTGTTSILAGNVSSGIEPVFDWSYRRNVLNADGTKREVDVEDYVVRLARHMGVPTSGEEWVTCADLSVDDHLLMVAAAQTHVDSGISKTINCPESISFEEFRDVYTKAHQLGLKGCTTFRPNAVTGSVLVRNEEAAKAVEQDAPAATETTGNVVQIGEKLERPATLKGRTYKLKPSGSEHAWYVTINDIEQHGRRRPFELFIQTKQVDGWQWTVALSRMVSAVFRKGGDVAFVAEELQQVFEPRGGYWDDGAYVPSICAGIGRILAQHMRDVGFMEADGEATAEKGPAKGKHCPKCQTGMLMMQEGCESCTSCDYTKCG